MTGATAYHIISKPIGPICNLSCEYCFYLEKKNTVFSQDRSFSMGPDILESYIRQYIQSQDIPEIQFAWQGGEPTLLGVDYFKKVVQLQKKYAGGKKISNGFQTNGILLDDHWCDFFLENDFLVGLSIDGPAKFHDQFRLDRAGNPTFKKVYAALNLLKRRRVKFNMMVVVNDANSRHPDEVYRFVKEAGDGFIQFIPLVERIPEIRTEQKKKILCSPPGCATEAIDVKVAPWSVTPRHLARFYIKIFDQWIRNDVGSVFIQFFDTSLGNWMGLGSGLCQFAVTCGATCAIEHNGDIYSCDHYVYQDYLIGNIMEMPLKDIVTSDRQKYFSAQKQKKLVQECIDCKVRRLCNGDCPKHRFETTSKGEAGLSYFCSAYKEIFSHMLPDLKKMEYLIRSGHPASDIMSAGSRTKPLGIKPNSCCPCGSSKKYKKCCGKKGNTRSGHAGY